MNEPLEPWMEELLNGASGNSMTEKQSRIFEAAIEIFAEKGYSATSTSEIASRAGVAEGTIFRHYKTKKDLLLSIVAPAMLRLIAPFVLREFKDVLKTEYESFDQFIAAMIENRLDFLDKNKSLMKILLQELPFHPDLREQFRKIIFSQVKERVEKVVDRFKEKGQIIDLPTSTVIRLAVSSIAGYIMIRTFYGMEEGAVWDDERERQATIDYIMRGLAPEK
ncbi:TetR family transcriptional regulator [Cohnella sp. CFH 77786]|uniref:TetR/AcrR family transcriptional regulator n=1 Tax=Cohnella sp. CFH 77786 TaxID=2662265 RepID=UPI001C60F97A|nr:TetR/AcrR family transcriptional regulator [Cohnella sp. CFH 77786]MBW5446282.1 TetR family transcriptional regulator [Cohnella sp. CFH 77786]